MFDHEMHIEWPGRNPFQASDNWYADGDVGHEVSVHDIDVNETGTTALDICDAAAKIGKVRGQNGWSDDRECGHFNSHQ